MTKTTESVSICCCEVTKIVAQFIVRNNTFSKQMFLLADSQIVQGSSIWHQQQHKSSNEWNKELRKALQADSRYYLFYLRQ